jgi:hypothetical protein
MFVATLGGVTKAIDVKNLSLLDEVGLAVSPFVKM